MNANQVAAWNMTRWRKAAGLTQEELGQRLGWSSANVSALERSADPEREARRFDAVMLTAIAAALGVPVVAMLLPPLDGSEGMAELFALTVPETGDDTPAMNAFRRERAFAAARYADPVRSRQMIEFMDAVASPEQRARLAAQRMDSLREAEREYRDGLRRAARKLLDEIGPDGET